MGLENSVKKKIGSAIESNKLDINLCSDYRNILENDNSALLNTGLDCFVRWRDDSNKGIYTLHTSYRDLLEKIDDKTIYRFEKAQKLKIV